MQTQQHEYECGSLDHVNRRTLLKAAGLSGLAWLTPLAQVLADSQEKLAPRTPARSVILLWLGGGPSQLETFDPHPDSSIAAGTKAIKTAVGDIELAAGMEQIAGQMESISLVRNVVSKEGDHERATYNVKTGYRPDPTLVHPGIGAVVCHHFPDRQIDVPRHVSILPGAWPARGGYLGNKYDAFKTGDPNQPIPDVKPRVGDKRFQQRLQSLSVVDREFVRGRLVNLDEQRTLHRATIDDAVRMMSSAQLKAFDVTEEPARVRGEFGDTPFGRGCLAAARLIEAGVRCVEVTLGGWDTHVNNHNLHDGLKESLDPAFASLIRYLNGRELLDHTVVICGGEFGRTPTINPAGGRDHWPHGFSVALAGGGIRGGRVVGETDPEGSKIGIGDGTPVADIHATVFRCLGIDHTHELDTPVGRPMKLSEGNVISALIA